MEQIHKIHHLKRLFVRNETSRVLDSLTHDVIVHDLILKIILNVDLSNLSYLFVFKLGYVVRAIAAAWQVRVHLFIYHRQ